MLNINRLPNGDLKLTADNETRAEIADLVKRGRGYWSVMADLLEPYSCNGSYTSFDAGEGNPFVGLSSAPCIAESLNHEDGGEQTIDGDFWYFADYAIRDDLAELKNKGRVIYTLASEATS